MCLLKPVWACGRGPWASISDCPRGRTVVLHWTQDEAVASKLTIDATACGGACVRMHRVVDIRTLFSRRAAA